MIDKRLEKKQQELRDKRDYLVTKYAKAYDRAMFKLNAQMQDGSKA